MHPILSERLILKPLTKLMIPKLLQVYSKQKNMQHISSGKYHWTLDELSRKYASLQKTEGFGIFAIYLKETDEIIGEAGLFNSFNSRRKAELGYIIDEAYWKKGLGTELCLLLINYCLTSTNFSILIARMYADNTGSINVSEKCGMKKVASHRTAGGRVYFEYQIALSTSA